MRASDPDRVEVMDDVRNINDPLLDYMYQVNSRQYIKGLRGRLSRNNTQCGFPAWIKNRHYQSFGEC